MIFFWLAENRYLFLILILVSHRKWRKFSTANVLPRENWKQRLALQYFQANDIPLHMLPVRQWQALII